MTIETMLSIASQLATGFVPGLITSAVYFAGLALGIRAARAARCPAMVLLASFGARFALLLGMAFWVAQFGGLEASGFAAAFVMLRVVLLRIVTRSTTMTIGGQVIRQGEPNAADT